MSGDLLTVQEVAVLFRVDEKSVIRWLHLGKLEGIRTPGGQWRIPRAAVEPFLPAGGGG